MSRPIVRTSEASVDPEVAPLRALVAERLGLSFEDDKLDVLEEALRKRARATDGGRLASYHQRLASPGNAVDELRALAIELTVGETYFFRNPNHFRAFVERMLPERLRALGNEPMRILCAGCASGEEPYTLAILAREALGAIAERRVRIVGIDVNRASLAKARAGLYSAWSLRATSAPMRQQHFRSEGTAFALDPAVMAMVAFEVENLADNQGGILDGSFDVIFCRNVLIYFTPDAVTKVLARLRRALRPGGYLVLGDAESLRDRLEDLELCQSHDTFYYGRPLPGAATWEPPREADRARDVARQEPRVEDPGAWMAAIEQASHRIERLCREPSRTPKTPPPDREVSVAVVDLDPIVSLVAREQFAEALDRLDSLPPAAAEQPRAMLLRALVLTNHRDLDGAEVLCETLIARGDDAPCAHHVLALCREQRGDTAGAERHHRVAASLDPTFAMPRMHLGILARRAGDADQARRELREAAGLLATEAQARIALFGGGFSRDALVGLCRAELRRAET